MSHEAFRFHAFLTKNKSSDLPVALIHWHQRWHGALPSPRLRLYGTYLRRGRDPHERARQEQMRSEVTFLLRKQARSGETVGLSCLCFPVWCVWFNCFFVLVGVKKVKKMSHRNFRFKKSEEIIPLRLRARSGAHPVSSATC